MPRTPRPILLTPLLLLTLGACADRRAAAAHDSASGTVGRATPDSTASRREGTPVTPAAATTPAAAERSGAAGAPGKLASNHAGRIPVVEYHVIGGEKNALYTRTVASYKADLDDLYRRGYRPITVAQMLDKDFRDVPDGMSPVAVVFDDASPEQFSYIEENGQLTIDPTSAVGIWQDFAKSHPGWSDRATFCLLNGAAIGHNFFGDNPKWHGQKKEWRFRKVKWLADQGFELCGHTLWHARLDKFSDAVVQEQIARNLMGIDSAVAGYKVRTFALPYGIWPKNRPLAWQGAWTDPKTKQTHAYRFDAVLEVAGGPTRNPYDPKFDPHSINRIEAIGDDIRRTLDRLDKGTGESGRFVK